MCDEIIAVGCDIVITEKGISDLAQHFFVKAGISAIRRVRKSDNNRLAKITGATIVTRTDELCSSDIGTQCGLFEIKKIGMLLQLPVNGVSLFQSLLVNVTPFRL